MIIYKATNNINGKSYIGYTTKSLNIRKKSHINNAFNKNMKYSFYSALRKYGEDNFEWSIIDFGKTLDELKEKEIYYINKFDTYNKGYNMTKGGDGQNGWKMDAKTKLKCSATMFGNKPPWNKGLKGEQVAWNKGIEWSDETKKKMSDIKKGKPTNVVFTDEVKEKIRLKATGRKYEYKKRRPKTDEEKINLSNARKGKYSGENHYMFGTKMSDETKKKISDTKKLKFKNE